MKSGIYSLILFCFLASASRAQPTFNNIDTLLTKNFEAVNQKDSVYYLSLLNLPAISKGKHLKNKRDSVKLLTPFTEAFSDMGAELREFAGSDNIEIKYESYRSFNTKEYDAIVSGKIMLHVHLLINNTFTVTIPFTIIADKGIYTIENPMLVMFAE